MEIEGMCKRNKSFQHCKQEQQSKCGMFFLFLFCCILFWCIFGCRATFLLSAWVVLHKVLPRRQCYILLAVIVFSSCPSCLLVPLLLMAGFCLGQFTEHHICSDTIGNGHWGRMSWRRKLFRPWIHGAAPYARVQVGRGPAAFW